MNSNFRLIFTTILCIIVNNTIISRCNLIYICVRFSMRRKKRVVIVNIWYVPQVTCRIINRFTIIIRSNSNQPLRVNYCLLYNYMFIKSKIIRFTHFIWGDISCGLWRLFQCISINSWCLSGNCVFLISNTFKRFWHCNFVSRCLINIMNRSCHFRWHWSRHKAISHWSWFSINSGIVTICKTNHHAICVFIAFFDPIKINWNTSPIIISKNWSMSSSTCPVILNLLWFTRCYHFFLYITRSSMQNCYI